MAARCFVLKLDHSAIRYLLVGVANTLVGLGTIYFCMYVLHFGNVPANAVGYLTGMVLSFTMNRLWTFKHSGAIAPALLRFVVVTGVAYAANLLTVVVLTEGLGMNRYFAQAAGAPPYTLVGYLGSRYFAFRHTV